MVEATDGSITPADRGELAVDLDGPTIRLVEAVGKALDAGQWLDGSLRAVRIGDNVRSVMGIRGTEISGRGAAEYLERVIRELEAEAARSARRGWGRYRTLWYLRRLPYEFFAFGSDLASTAPYDLWLTEVLMTRGSDPGTAPRRLDAKGCFPIDDSVARRLAREMGFAKAVSEYQRHYRRCAKGATLRFERRGRLPSFGMPRELSSSIRLYDERRAGTVAGPRTRWGALARLGCGTLLPTAGAASRISWCWCTTSTGRPCPWKSRASTKADRSTCLSPRTAP